MTKVHRLVKTLKAAIILVLTCDRLIRSHIKLDRTLQFQPMMRAA
ncbi:MAG: hypothetical protein AB4352_09220 [Hormoscilla sp.]